MKQFLKYNFINLLLNVGFVSILLLATNFEQFKNSIILETIYLKCLLFYNGFALALSLIIAYLWGDKYPILYQVLFIITNLILWFLTMSLP